jgi:hypothetical protein
MVAEKKELLCKINALIHKRKEALLDKFPTIHKIEDGIIIRFFSEWDNCDNTDIKYRKIPNEDRPDEIIIFFYLPKGTYFELEKRDYIGFMTCLNGKLELNFDNKIRILNSYTKICLNSDTFEGRALENTYVITTNKP